MTIAVTGATGQLGRLVVESLKAKTAADGIVALVRSTEKAADLGVEARAFDYSRPETMAAALSDVDTLVLISSSEIGQRAVQHRNVIDAAKAAGVGRIVYTSLLHADTSLLDLAAEHVETERDLVASGLPVTVLRNGWYTENYTGSVPDALQGGALIGSAGDARVSSAARADYAEAAALVATQDGHAGKTYELAGDTAWTLPELAAEISRQSGRDISYKNMPQADYAAALKSFGLPESFAAAIAGWDVAAAQGALFDEGRQLSKLIGRQTTPLAASVEAAIG